MEQVRIFHNPRCSKSREALALLEARGVAAEVIEYLSTPPSLGELQALLALLKRPARELLRSGEDEYTALNLADPGLSDVQLLSAITAHPRLLQRPIVVRGQRAVIARPPELLQSLFD
ncbi:arsenate reductase (glutaredoxin) [Paucibacter sp. APW11]|uniref:Arsenate reductase n=1 Tax=Roseateles aquae TaxID=3077235 RepID=A0ABU3PDR5_9BURK|nr:arsenate reductase (glutaredoxin) [Paucibacter sp. APW11]MDT9000470.1 arsenate reductase (glutaredoxin) [Paucibacter sp. APW11]